jgi:hypothetical protein
LMELVNRSAEFDKNVESNSSGVESSWLRLLIPFIYCLIRFAYWVRIWLLYNPYL